MILNWIHNTGVSDYCNCHLTCHDGIEHRLVDYHPARAVVFHFHFPYNVCKCGRSIQSYPTVNRRPNHIQNPPNSLEERKFVNNSVPFTGAVPDPDQPNIQIYIDCNLDYKYWEHRILADKYR